MVPASDWEAPTELPDLRGRGVTCIDVEGKDDGLAMGRGPGWVYKAGHISGVSMAAGDRAVYVPINHPDTPGQFDKGQVARWVDDHMQAGDDIVFQNAPFDLGWFAADMGLKPPPEGKVRDTMAASYMIDEYLMERNLDYLCKWQGLPGKDETLLRAYAYARGMEPKKDLWRIPARYVGPYAEIDAVRTLQLHTKLLPQLSAQDLMPAYQLECDLIPMVLEMRRRGIRIDTDNIDRVQRQLLGERDAALAELTRQCSIGRAITIHDVDSPIMMERLFNDAGQPYPRTEKGNPSFKAEWMEKRDHWLPQLCAKASKLHDAGYKFVGQYMKEYLHHGRIHAEVHQFKTEEGGTRTSRLSYSNPPLQQMIGDKNPELAVLIRSLFLPEQGEVWCAPDYSQQELRLMVHFGIACEMAGVEAVADMYRDDPDTDFHNMTSELTGLVRRKAKDVTFAKAFGAGKAKFAAMTGLPLDEASAAMDQYDDKLPFIKRLSEFSQARAQKRGYIKLIDGARSHFDRWEPRWVDWPKMRQHMIDVGWPDMPVHACSHAEAMERVNDPRHYWYQERLQRHGTHKAMNSLIQGSAARQTKLAMRACWREGIVPLLQMHDELSSSLSRERDAVRMQEIMVDAVHLEIPVRVDLECGVNWGTAKKNKSTGYTATFAEAMALVRAQA